ncbi:MAG: hypothetical protein SFX18_00225 [Pirellulales bacterium]|nr:hypothetical protein [Pirellulales bacterium]
MVLFCVPVFAAQPTGLTLAWQENILTIRSDALPGGELKIWYLEAYCRPGSTDRDWHDTVIGHTTKLLSASADGKSLKLQCTLTEGVTVIHEIRAGDDEIDFRLLAHNPTERTSAAHWAQPCIRVGDFTGLDKTDYLKKCFIFVDGRLARMPTRDWATEGRYVPGQVWAAPGIDKNDVNPRPLSAIVPQPGLIGCFSADEKLLMAASFEPYQELFQGIITCLHSDFRLGGLQPGETKQIRGKLYLLPNDVPKLLERHKLDFPEQWPTQQPKETAKTTGE